MNETSDIPPFILLITGERPGTGETTAAKTVAEKLNIPRHYAGLTRRKLAFIWHNEFQDQDKPWYEFEAALEQNEIDLDSILFDEDDFDETILVEFNHAQSQGQINTDLIDNLIDNETKKVYQAAIENRQALVIGAKLAVLLDLITGNEVDFDNKDIPIIPISLVVDTITGIERVMKRKIEKNEVGVNSRSEKELFDQTAEQITKRIKQDWTRFEHIYDVHPQDLYREGIIQIDTTNLSPEEVVQAICVVIRDKAPETAPALLEILCQET